MSANDEVACGWKRHLAPSLTLPATPQEPNAMTTLLPLNSLRECSWSTRRRFDLAALDSLAESIRRHGILQPLLVQAKAEQFEILAGARRYRAAALAELQELPCRILHGLDATTAREITLIENLQHERLDPIEEASAIAILLLKNGGMLTEQEVADRLKRSQGWVSQRIGLLRLPEPLRQRIAAGELTPFHGRQIVPWSDLAPVMEELVQEFDRNAAGLLRRWPVSLHEILWSKSRPLEAHERTETTADPNIRQVPSPWGGWECSMLRSFDCSSVPPANVRPSSGQLSTVEQDEVVPFPNGIGTSRTMRRPSKRELYVLLARTQSVLVAAAEMLRAHPDASEIIGEIEDLLATIDDRSLAT